MFNSEWYKSLVQPPLSPDASVFVPVWGVLYLAIFISLILFMQKRSENKAAGYVNFIIQLILNLLWSPVFFGLKNIGLALIIIIFMNYYIFKTIKEFYPISNASAILLIPYQLWVIFATYLNVGYFVLNQN